MSHTPCSAGSDVWRIHQPHALFLVLWAASGLATLAAVANHKEQACGSRGRIPCETFLIFLLGILFPFHVQASPLSTSCLVRRPYKLCWCVLRSAREVGICGRIQEGRAPCARRISHVCDANCVLDANGHLLLFPFERLIQTCRCCVHFALQDCIFSPG